MKLVDLTPMMGLFIAIMAAILTPRLVRWLNVKTDAEELAKLREWAKIAVTAAEQLYKAGDGAAKKEYVRNFLTAHGFDIDFAELNNAIEAAVLELHSELYGIVNS